jgi:peroxiredoxin
MSIKIGEKAPDFTLPDTEKKLRTLGEFLGTKSVLAFFPGAFTGVCTKEMCALRDSLAKFNDINARVIGVSVDSPAANKAFAGAHGLEFTLLSDYTRSVSMEYGGVHPDFWGLPGYAVSKRAVFVLDSGNVVRYAWVSENPGLEPPYADLERILREIS